MSTDGTIDTSAVRIKVLVRGIAQHERQRVLHQTNEFSLAQTAKAITQSFDKTYP